MPDDKRVVVEAAIVVIEEPTVVEATVVEPLLAIVSAEPRLDEATVVPTVVLTTVVLTTIIDDENRAAAETRVGVDVIQLEVVGEGPAPSAKQRQSTVVQESSVAKHAVQKTTLTTNTACPEKAAACKGTIGLP